MADSDATTVNWLWDSLRLSESAQKELTESEPGGSNLKDDPVLLLAVAERLRYRKLIFDDRNARLRAICVARFGEFDGTTLGKLIGSLAVDSQLPMKEVGALTPDEVADLAAQTCMTDARQTDKRVTASDEQPSLEARALALLTDHPDWTDTRIAEVLQCNRGSLYRLDKFKAARELLKRDGIASADHGSRADGRIEAWEANE
jgi:hypothetical protein